MVGRGREGLSLDVVRLCLFMIPVLVLTMEVEAVSDRAKDRLGRRRCESGRKSLLGLRPLCLVSSLLQDPSLY